MIDPLLLKQLRRFRKNRRGYYSFCILTTLFCLSLFSELLCNHKPYLMSFEGRIYFPLFKFYPGELFGEKITAEIDYRELEVSERFKLARNWMIFPPIHYSPNETMKHLPMPPPTPPSSKNWLGTDDRGRDLAARLLYGFRNSMVFALASWFFIVWIAYVFGAVQGYFGGRMDLLGQRFSEIWSALPVLYVIIFLLSIFPASLVILTITWVVFGWLNLASYVRADVLRVRKMDFIVAARALGAGTPRILFRHILPNSLTPILTFTPFIISASIGSLAALDYLGLGLPPPTSSWGELLRQGKENLRSEWLSFSPFFSLFSTLLLLNFIGEALRSAADAKG